MNKHDLLMLYLDGELDDEVQEEIENQLEADDSLKAELSQLIQMRSYISDLYEQQESTYELDGLSDRIMDSLGKPSWTVDQTTIQLDKGSLVHPESSSQSWWSKNLFPLFIGAAVAAALLLVVNAFNAPKTQSSPSTVLIQDQVDKEASPVIWVLDEEESEHELDNDEENPI